MRKSWIMLNELIFTIRVRRKDDTVHVMVDNVPAGDMAFMKAVAQLIGAWTKEVTLCPRPTRKA